MGTPEKCGHRLDRGSGERPRFVPCKKLPGHDDGWHFGTWGGSQAWRQAEWDDEGRVRQPLDLAEVARRAHLAERKRIVAWLRATYSPARMADRIEAGEHIDD